MPVVTRPTLPSAEPAPASGELAAAEYFALLLEEAAAIEFEGPVVRARTAGADSATVAGLERVKLLALQVRDAFAARRRRESELAALFDTAGDLAALRSVDDVLTAIVRRARQLLGTDVSYLTLHDDARGDTYMRVTDGSVSARFQSLRLPMGAASAAWSRRPLRRTPPPATSPTRGSSTPTTSTAASPRRAWSPSSACRWSAARG
jgi:hypothetical protein